MRDIGPGKNFGCGFSDGFLAGEIDFEWSVVYAGKLGLEGRDAFLEFGITAAGYYEMGW